jgi:hypothetical protein
MCCQNGKVILAPISDPPPALVQLFTAQTPTANLFRLNIRAYNTAMSFTSHGAHVVQPPNTGPYSYRLHGESYHLIGSILPQPAGSPAFAQIYFHDSANAQLEMRMAFARRGGLRIEANLLRSLQAILLLNNPFALQFKQIGDQGLQNNEKLIIKERIEDDGRRYNAPTATEISVLIPGTTSILNCQDGSESTRDIILTNLDGSLKRVSELSGAYDPLQYPLLFPFGDYGHHLGIPHQSLGPRPSTKTVTTKQFYANLLQVRPGQNSLLHLGGKLFQQFVVDQFSKVEGERLRYIRFNQKALRVDSYKNVFDAVTDAQGANLDAGRIGQRFILPSTFIGGPRFMNSLYQDSMAVVRYLGHPDLFVTFTCNPMWKEIQRELLPGQTASDRPDLVSRVFHAKLKLFLADLEKIPGFAGRFYAIEFQKRGLPHAHILEILSEAHKLRTPAKIDAMVSAQFSKIPEVREKQKNNMIHGPCGKYNPSSPCMVNGKCIKDFPKPYAEETSVTTNGYPTYCRPRPTSPEDYVEVRGHKLDCSWLVPTNLAFLQKYDAHINFEISSSIKGVKYIHKYVYKGPDMATVRIGGNNDDDEIENFLNCRYICPPEAIWRLLGFESHGNSFSVLKLAVHEEGADCLVFAEDAENLGDRVNTIRHSTLTAWFHQNSLCDDFKDVLYSDMPLKASWVPKDRCWKKRARVGKQIGRIIWVSPFQRERYFLRMLLHKVKGCKSFEDVRTVNGIVCATYQLACMERGLLEDDQEWVECLEEAALTQSGRQLRSLLCTLLLFNNPADPLELWNRFKDEFSEDLLYAISQQYANWTPAIQEQVANLRSLRDIKAFLYSRGKAMSEYGLDSALDDLEVSVGALDQASAADNPLIHRHKNFNHQALAANVAIQRAKFNPEQEAFFVAVDNALYNPTPGQKKIIYLGAPGKQNNHLKLRWDWQNFCMQCSLGPHSVKRRHCTWRFIIWNRCTVA